MGSLGRGKNSWLAKVLLFVFAALYLKLAAT
jgi:hypothetical protein